MYDQYQVWLTTLDYVRQHRRLASTQTTDDNLIADLIEECSAEFIQAIQRMPLPYVATRTIRRSTLELMSFRHEMQLSVPGDLLVISGLTWVGTALTSSQYRLASEDVYPNRYVAVDRDAITTYPGDFDESISVSGIWGYMPHYPTAFKDSGQDVPVGDLAASATTVTVADSSVFEVGDYIRINSEYLFVSANDTGTGQLTIERGVLGSTATEHSEGDAIERIIILNDIRGAVRDMVVWKYLSKDQIGGSVQILQGGQVIVEGLNPQVQKTIDRHRYWIVGSI